MNIPAGVIFFYETESNIHVTLGRVTIHAKREAKSCRRVNAGAKIFMKWTPGGNLCLQQSLVSLGSVTGSSQATNSTIDFNI